MEETNLIEKEVNALFTPQEVDTLVKFYELDAKVKFIKDSKKKELIEIFKKYNLKSFKNENLSITYVAPGKKKIVDNDALKKEGLYENYLKEVDVAEQIRIAVNYEG